MLLERCLEKEAKDRLSGISDARVDIQKALADPSGVPVEPIGDVVQAAPRPMIPWLLAAVVLTAVTAGATVWNLKPEVPGPVSRFSHVLPEGQTFTNTGSTLVAISPNGSRMVYVANQQLHIRAMDALDSTPIPGTDETPAAPFFSPDGRWLGYWWDQPIGTKELRLHCSKPPKKFHASSGTADFTSAPLSWVTC